MDIKKEIESRLSENAKEVMKLLESSNFDAYAVGGCVRDFLLGKSCHDEDVTTNARPNEVIDLFRKNGYNVVETGLQHGTVTVFPKNSKEGFEVTTFRSETDYSDGRHPDEVVFEDSIEKDLERRDFTINAMAYSLSKGFTCAKAIDKDGITHDGLSDLNDGIIRAVGNPNERISEDSLRMMRAVRFAAKFGYKIDSSLEDAIRENANRITLVSAERINDEIVKLISTGNVEYFDTLHDVGLLKEIIPELDACYGFDQKNNWHKYTLGEHIIETAKYIAETSTSDDKLYEIEAALLHDIGKVKDERMAISLNNKDISKFLIENNLVEEKLYSVDEIFKNIKPLVSKELREQIEEFEATRQESSLFKLKESFTNMGYDLSKMRYTTVERDGKTIVGSRFAGHADTSADMAYAILKRLKKPNDEIKYVVDLVKYHDLAMNIQYKEDCNKIREQMTDFFIAHQDLANERFINSLFTLTDADKNAQNLEMYIENNYLPQLENFKTTTNIMLKNPHLISDLNINGKDLMALGFQGKEIQEEKKRLLELIMNGKIENSKETLIDTSFKRVQKFHKDYLAVVDFDYLNSMNNLGDRILQNLKYIDYSFLSANKTLSNDMIEHFKDSLDWTELTSMINQPKGKNIQERFNEEFARKYEDKLDYKEFSNPNLKCFNYVLENHSDELDLDNFLLADKEAFMKKLENSSVKDEILNKINPKDNGLEF